MDRAIKAANKKLDFVTMDEDFQRYYTLRQMALSDYTSGIEYAREEGRNEGRKETSLEIARKMKTAGRPLSEIAEFTGLPAETIKQL